MYVTIIIIKLIYQIKNKNYKYLRKIVITELNNLILFIILILFSSQPLIVHQLRHYLNSLIFYLLYWVSCQVIGL